MGSELSGPITPTLYVSSDAKDTDFTVKVLDVYPDGRAYNLDESIQRMRYREGYDKAAGVDGKGEGLQGRRCSRSTPATTSRPDTASGSKCRAATSRASIAISIPAATTTTNRRGSSRSNTIHHSKQYPSSVTITVVKPKAQGHRGVTAAGVTSRSRGPRACGQMTFTWRRARTTSENVRLDAGWRCPFQSSMPLERPDP